MILDSWSFAPGLVIRVIAPGITVIDLSVISRIQLLSPALTDVLSHPAQCTIMFKLVCD